MFTLMYHRPPFLEGEKLAQINGSYRIPKFPEYSEFCTKLLKAMLTVDPAQRASAEQVFTATQNLTDICLPQLNALDKDGFKFPAGMKYDGQFEDFAQQPQIRKAQAPPLDSVQGAAASDPRPSPANGSAAGSQPNIAEDNRRQGAEDTSLVDSLLDEVKEEPTLENKSSTMTNQSQQH